MDKPLLQGIDTVILRVSDIERSKKWYTEKLGLQSVHQDEILRLVVLDTFSPTSLTIWETNEKIQINPGTSSYPIFRTLNAKDTHEKLKNHDIEVGELTTDHVVTYFTFHDPDHNILEVCQVHN